MKLKDVPREPGRMTLLGPTTPARYATSALKLLELCLMPHRGRDLKQEICGMPYLKVTF